VTLLHLADRAPLHPFRQVAKKNQPLNLLACEVFPRSTELPIDHGQSSQSDADPDQLAETPLEREGNAGGVGVAEDLEEEQMPPFWVPRLP